MTMTYEKTLATWSGPHWVPQRGTLVVLPGRGETPTVYERFGRRLASDAYRVHAVVAPSGNPEQSAELVAQVLDEADPTLPRVLVGSDAGAVFAAQLVAQSRVGALSALILAGLPAADASPVASDWDGELDARTFCTTHRDRITTAGVEPGELYRNVPTEWYDAAVPENIAVPVLGLHGGEDPVSPLSAVRSWYERVPVVELVSINGGRHDALNDQTHRTAAATIVLFLERLRLSADLAPIAVAERLHETEPIPRG